MPIDLGGPARYLRFQVTADRFTQITGERNGKPMDRSAWRASNLFAHPSQMKLVKARHSRVRVDDRVPGAKLAIAIEGTHGIEGTYVALEVGDDYVGCPDRAASYPSNTWEYVNARRDRGYTYFAPVTEQMIGKPIDVWVFAYDEAHIDLRPVVWHTADPRPVDGKLLELE